MRCFRHTETVKGRNSMAIDLHAHTTASDGTLTPSGLVKRAKQNGLTGVAVTDHDTLDGIEEAKRAGESLGILVVPGVEINTEWQGKEVHLLGYFVDPGDQQFQTLLRTLREARVERVARMVAKLTVRGLDITMEEVLSEAAGAAVGRPHIARVLVRKGLAKDTRDAFDRFLQRGRPGYVERYKLHPKEAVAAIRQAGGCPVLAHPGLIGNDAIIAELAEYGLEGLETDHPDHDTSMRQRYRNMAEQWGLVATGGSDFHGTGAEHRGDLGTVTVARETVDALYRRRPPLGR
jgi:predicted metal-dependent phosphoesterase TrpH